MEKLFEKVSNVNYEFKEVDWKDKSYKAKMLIVKLLEPEID
jgi:hypothetical protein